MKKSYPEENEIYSFVCGYMWSVYMCMCVCVRVLYLCLFCLGAMLCSSGRDGSQQVIQYARSPGRLWFLLTLGSLWFQACDSQQGQATVHTGGGDLIGVSIAVLLPGDLSARIRESLTTTFRADKPRLPRIWFFCSWFVKKEPAGNRWRTGGRGHGEGELDG